MINLEKPCFDKFALDIKNEWIGPVYQLMLNKWNNKFIICQFSKSILHFTFWTDDGVGSMIRIVVSQLEGAKEREESDVFLLGRFLGIYFRFLDGMVGRRRRWSVSSL